MERLSANKKLAVVIQYLSGQSYDEIAAKTGVSKGAVANIVAELKAGRFPEATDAAEHIEQLRELSLDLKRSTLTPGQCATGLAVLIRIRECGLDPADIDRWPLILKSAGSEDEAQEFVRLVYSIQEVQQRTGLSLDALDDKVHELERKATDLEPMSGKLADCKKQLADLTKQRGEIAGEIAGLEQKYNLLNPLVKDLEKREQDLSRRIKDMEARAEKAEVALNTLSKDRQRLVEIGLSLETLGELRQRVQSIAQRHHIKPAELRDRLLRELESLEQGLGLETLIQSRQMELEEMEQLVAKGRQELEAIKAVVASLKQQKASLEASIRHTREKVSEEIAKIIPIARDSINQLAGELQCGVDMAIAEVNQLRDRSLEVGKEVGRYEEMFQANQWLSELLALARGDESVAGRRVRTIVSSLVRGMAVWLKRHSSESPAPSSLSFATDSLLRELERWSI